MSDSPFNNTFGTTGQGQRAVTPNTGTPPTPQPTLQKSAEQAQVKPVQDGVSKPADAPKPVQNPAQSTAAPASVGMSLPQQKPTQAVIDEPVPVKEEPKAVAKPVKSRVLPRPIEEVLEIAPDAKFEIAPTGYRWIIFDGEQGVCELQESENDFDVLEARTFKRRHQSLSNLKEMLDFYFEYRTAARKDKVEVSAAPPLLNKAVIENMAIVV